MRLDMQNFLQLEGVCYAYPERSAAVSAVNLQMAAGEIHCLIGRSGCGKTTLLKLAAGLLSPQQGQVLLNKRTVTAPLPEMGFVFQSPTLLDWLNVRDNVLLPLSLHRSITPDDHRQVDEWLERLGLAALSLVKADSLSGGQQSRVAIARALITRPSVLFMDEPFAALDAITRGELQHDFLKLCQAEGTTVLFVTHDIGEAVYLGDRVSLMQDGAMSEPLAIDLPRPRSAALRYAAPFNALCAQLRQAMDEGTTHEA